MKEPYIKPNLIVRETDTEIIVFEPPKMSFGKKLGIYLSLWIVLTIAACLVAWSAVTQFDRAQPIYTIEQYSASSKQDLFFSAISGTEFDKGNEYETAYELAGMLAQHYQNKFSYTEDETEYTTKNPVYIIKHNGTDLFKVVLEQQKPTGLFGFTNYAVKKIELLDTSKLEFNAYRFVFPSNAYVFINGHRLDKSISDKYVMFDIFESERPDLLNKGYYEEKSNNYYGIVIENFAFEPTVTSRQFISSEQTAELECRRDGNYFIFDYPGARLYSMIISTPENSDVYINNRLVSDMFLTGSSVYGESLNMKEYTIPTVYGNSKIQALIGESMLTIVADESKENAYIALP